MLLDSGFQHRRLHRDLDLVACNVDQAHRRDRLPAGPYRERFTALRRAEGVLLLRRAATREQAEGLEEEVLAAGAAPARGARALSSRRATGGQRGRGRHADAPIRPSP